MPTRLSRRKFLGSSAIFGAAGLLQPALPSLSTADIGDGRRLLFIQTGNGSVLPAWRPKNRNGDWLADQDVLDNGATSPILDPLLQNHASRMILIDGLDMAAGVGTSEGHASHQTIWTGRFEDGRAYDGQGANDGVFPGGPSIDQTIADQWSMPVHSLSMSFGDTNYEDSRRNASYTEGGSPIVPKSNAEQIYAELFGDELGEGEVDRRPIRRRRGLQLLQDELSSLQRRLPASDVRRLQTHVDALTDIGSRLDLEPSCRPMPPSAPADYLERGVIHQALIRQAFACNATRAITYNLSPESGGGMEPWVEGYVGPDDIHHTSHNSRTSAEATMDMVRVKRWEAEWVADLVDGLHNTPDAGGTLLDNTVVVWCMAMSHGGHHSVQNTPCVIIHGEEGPWSTNQYIRASGAQDITMEEWSAGSAVVGPKIGNGFANNHLLVSIAQAFGLNINRFGDERFTGPLAELSR